MLTLLLCLLATISIHRIWHYEDIFAPVRAMLGARWLLDPVWSFLWIIPLVGSVTFAPPEQAQIILALVACYAPLRGLVWVHDRLHPQKQCSPCEEKRRHFEAKIQEYRSFVKRVIFLGADAEQANWLAQKHPDWLVFVTGTQDQIPGKLWKNVRYQKISTVNDLASIVAIGGNATIVTWHATTVEPWKSLILSLRPMKGTTWVHVGHNIVGMPADHTIIAPDEPLDQHL